MRNTWSRCNLPLLGLAAAFGCSALLAAPAGAKDKINFKLVPTKGLPAGCAPKAKASAKLETLGFAERLTITVSGFAPGTPLVLFAIQIPNAPFGVGWYLSDLEIGPKGTVTKRIITRLNDETFAVGNAAAPAPQTHPEDADNSKAFKPVHTYHLGIWFDSVEAGASAGCPGGPTVFNGDHTAGVQVLNTGTFEDDEGPLLQI